LSDSLGNIGNRLNILYGKASRYTTSLIDRAKMTEHLFMIMVAIIIGILAGFGAIGIRTLIKEISDLCFTGDGTLLERLEDAPWWVLLSVPTIGGLIVGPLISKFAPEAKGHGVPEVMQSVLLRGGLIRPRVAIVKALASAITIGTGGSVGREGPIIQIGASLGSTVGQFFRVPSKRMKTLVGCGAAAGIAAAFNAPIAGALFAVEIILMDFAVAQFSPIVIASVMATVVSHQFEGDFAAFAVPGYHLQSPVELSFYFILGILAGLVSYAFIKVLYFSEELWDEKLKIPNKWKAGIGGLIVGCTALIFPQIMGVGYDSINMALNSHGLWYMALILIFLKIFSTSITLGSGGSGGIFAPSLFMGAMLGAFFGSVVHGIFPEITAQPGAYALVAMGGLVAGTTRAPITAIIIVFELTKDYNIILPLMITCIIATMLSSKLSRESIYTLKLLLRNINIKDSAEMNVMKSLMVNDVYHKKFECIGEDHDFSDVVQKLITRRIPYLYVQELNGNFMGIISIHNIKDFFFEKEELKYLLIAGDIADKHVIRVNTDDNCKSVLDRMSQCKYDGLPVFSSDNPNKQVGIIWRQDIDEAYRKEIEHIEMTSDLANKITQTNLEKDVHFLEGYVITEIPVPEHFVGKSILELNVRANYGVDILTIKSQIRGGRTVKAIPQAGFKFKQEDIMVLAGKIEDITILKNII
jgi:chloride channel protein, CIC family